MKKNLFLFFTFLIFSIFAFRSTLHAQSLPVQSNLQSPESLPSSELIDFESYKKRLDEIQQEQVILQKRISEGQENLKTESAKAKSFLEIEEITPEEFKPYLNQWRLMYESYRDVLKDLEATIDEVSQIQIRLDSKLKLFRLKLGDLQLLQNRSSSTETKSSFDNSIAEMKRLIELYDSAHDEAEKVATQLGKNKTALILSFQVCERNQRLLEEKWKSIRFSRFKMRQQPKFSSETFLLSHHELKFRIENYEASLEMVQDYFRQVIRQFQEKPVYGIFILLISLILAAFLIWLKKSTRRLEIKPDASLLEKFGKRFFISFSSTLLFFFPFLVFEIVLLFFQNLRQPIGNFILLASSFGYLMILIISSLQILFQNNPSSSPILSISPSLAKIFYRRSIFLLGLIYLLIIFHLIASVLEYESEATRLVRWILEISIFAILFLSTRVDWILSFSHHPDRWLPRFLRYFLRPFIFLMLVTLVLLDGFGLTYLSDYLADATLKSLTLIPIILFLKKGLDELINHNFFAKGFDRFKINYELLSKWKRTLHHWIVLGLWTLFIFWITSIWDATPEFLTFLRKFLDLGFKIGSIQLTIGLILSVFLTFYLSIVVSRLIRAILERNFYKKPQWDIGIQHAVNTGIHYLIVLIGILIALRLLGFDIQNITVLAGALGVGLGFGLQNLANNFASGIVLLIERPVKVGDLIQLQDLIGRVKQIGARSTMIETGERATILVPNGELISSHVTNWTYGNSIAGFSIPIGVTYDSDLKKVKEVLVETASSNSEILSDPAPHVEFKGFGESSIDLVLKVWLKNVEKKGEVQTEIFFKIYEAFQKHQIKVPYPHREVFLHQKE